MAGFWESAMPGATGAYGYNELMNRMGDQRDKIGETITGMQGEVDQRTQFQPWSIRGSMGETRGGPDGMVNNLSSQGRGIQNQMFGQGREMMGRAAQDPAVREAEIYDRIRAMQMPGEERGYNQMNSAAMRQGRTGMGSAEYGGSPEQMAFAKAQAEARNTAGFQSMGQAQSELLNQYNMGSGMLDQGYKPNSELMKQAGMGMNNAQLGQKGQMAGADLWAQLGLGGLTADTNMSNIEGNAYGNFISAMMPAMSGMGAGVDNAISGYTNADTGNSGYGGLWDSFTGLFS
jgi:hypothetical protein